MNQDFLDLLVCLQDAGARFLVVGAHALAVHGHVRATGDLDVFVRPDPENAARVLRGLGAFGAPLTAHEVTERDFAEPGNVYQIGNPPNRIDILTRIDGVSFDQAWSGRRVEPFADRDIPYLGFDDLLANKRAAGRPKDLGDIAALEAIARRKP